MVIGRRRSAAVAVWVVSTVLTALFLFAGGTKLAGTAMHVEHFAQWGYPGWFRLFVGTWEVTFGALLLVPSLAFYAACALALGMLGAIYTEMFRGDPQRALFPLVLLGILIVLIRVRAAARWGP
jgi:putative oxidoreductase